MSVFRRIRNIIKSKRITWSTPSRRKTLIYGKHNVSYIINYLDSANCGILDLNELNIPVLFQSLLKLKFDSKSYYIEYIKKVSPECIVTAIDNDTFFWSIKRHIKGVKTIMIQYAWHGELGDVFGELKRLKPDVKFDVDYLLVFNSNIGLKYQEYINGSVHVIGSLKNNLTPLSDFLPMKDKMMTFISQYRPEQVFHPVFFYEGDEPYYRDDFYKTEVALLPLIYDYCVQNGYRLQILGHGTTAGEYQFFGQMIGNYNWDFIPRVDVLDSYKTVIRSGIVVGVDSALLYESFGKGKRTGFFNMRYEAFRNDSYRFGWPGAFDKNGPFWAGEVNSEQVERVLNYLVQVDENEWKYTLEKYRDGIMAYDPGNTRLVNLFRELGLPLKSEFQ